jgi:hypothetical protein
LYPGHHQGARSLTEPKSGTWSKRFEMRTNCRSDLAHVKTALFGSRMRVNQIVSVKPQFCNSIAVSVLRGE